MSFLHFMIVWKLVPGCSHVFRKRPDCDQTTCKQKSLAQNCVYNFPMPAPDPKRLRRAVTCAVVLNDAGQVLLQQRTDGGRWNLPGGAIEVGERADQTIVREVLEETGYTVEVVRLSGVYSDPAQTTVTYPGGDVVAYVALCFVCKMLGGAPALSSESAGVDWFDPDRLPDHFYAGHVVRLRDAIEARASAFFR